MTELISKIIARYKNETGKTGNMTEREMKLIEISLLESKQTGITDNEWKKLMKALYPKDRGNNNRR